MASISQGRSGFECNNEHKNTLRTGQDRQVLVPRTSGSCGGETWVSTGQGSSQLESWPCTCLSGDITSAPKRPLGLLLQQQPGWGPAPTEPQGPAAHQLAPGPAEYFRVESPFSAVPCLDPGFPQPGTCLPEV